MHYLDYPSTCPTTDSSTTTTATGTATTGTTTSKPSEATTKLPTSSGINPFYPDQTQIGHNTGCINDGSQPSWMNANPTNWLFSSLDKCCKQHFSWNYNFCMGIIEETTSHSSWYPDWEGNNKGCIQDGDVPSYMTRLPGNYLFNTKKDCCQKYYSWNYAECVGEEDAGSGENWYVDWTSGDDTCKNDGKAPKYMIQQAELWLFELQEDCCTRFYSYDMARCMGSKATGKFFPDWSGDNEGCRLDGGSDRAPSYMLRSKMWLYDTIDQCCEVHFRYKLMDCKGTSPPGTNKWYVDWPTFKCVQDCSLGSKTDCGGLGGSWDILYDTRQKCCQERVGFNYKNCMA
ncbi:hypothetical protein ACHAW6_010776 [Cyclotella cf. meneghiniana]